MDMCYLLGIALFALCALLVVKGCDHLGGGV